MTMLALQATTQLLKNDLFHQNPTWEHTLTPGGAIVSLSPAAPAIQRRLEQERVCRLVNHRAEAALAAEVA
jgi:hypothetical protein